MKRSKRFRWAGVLALAIALTASSASAQEDDTLMISGTFSMDSVSGTVGDDLAEVYANDDDHWWTLTLYGVTYTHNIFPTGSIWADEWDEYQEYEFNTKVHATSFDFEFSGPNAGVLNDVVSHQLGGGWDDGAFLALRNLRNYSLIYDSFYIGRGTWELNLLPLNVEGVSFRVSNYSWMEEFASDAEGCPLIIPQQILAYYSDILDHRPGNNGRLRSFPDYVNLDLGAIEPPPPPLTTVSINDASVKEGKRGTTNLNLIVTLSASSVSTVTVNYATADGTAIAGSDYYAKSGTISFQPGQTSKSIAISVKGDRTREPNETFYVDLFNPTGAIIADGEATATILNDD